MKIYRTKEVMEILKLSKKTIENYEKQGKLVPIRNGLNKTKFYTDEIINKFLNLKLIETNKTRKVIAYYRVSTNNQLDEIKNQRKFIENFCSAKGQIVDEYLMDVGSGINFKRKNFLKIIDMIENDIVEELIITYKDRLTRFAFDLIEERCKVRNTKLTIINLQSTSPQQELVEDLMTIIHVFSSRLYGLRKYNKIIKDNYVDDKK